MSVSELLTGHDRVAHELRRTIMQDLHCALPGIVTHYDPSTQTVSVQPAVKEKANGGSVQLPLLLDVPVFFPGGASCAITFQVQEGDPCLIVFADTQIDGWIQRGSVSSALIPRRHSLSDGFAFVGFRPNTGAIQGVEDDSLFAVRVKGQNGWTTPLAVSKDGRVLINGREVNA